MRNDGLSFGWLRGVSRGMRRWSAGVTCFGVEFGRHRHEEGRQPDRAQNTADPRLDHAGSLGPRRPPGRRLGQSVQARRITVGQHLGECVAHPEEGKATPRNR